MTTATLSPKAAKATPKAPKAVTPKATAPTPAQTELVPGWDGMTETVRTEHVLTLWASASSHESAMKDIFKTAKINAENSRVLKCRVAFLAAMVKPNDGQPNRANACRILDLAKNTARPYIDGGIALFEAGMASRMTEPDANERKIVADTIRAAAQAAKESKAAKATETTGNTTGEPGDTPAGDDVALTYVDLVGHVARLNKTLDLIISSNVLVTEDEAANMADMMAGFMSKLTEYTDGK